MPDHSLSPGSLNYGTTYYWRVDEVNAVTYPGEVWSFTTQAYAVVDDFESYTDKTGNRKSMRRWIDGFDRPATNGAVVGQVGGSQRHLLPKRPSSTAASRRCRSPTTTQGRPSEATRTFDPPQDWSQHGVTTLVLFFRGDPANAGAPIYVKINGTKVLYNNGAASTTLPLWKQWNIDLASLGASLKSVKTLTIGVGNGSASAGGNHLCR